MFALVFRSGRHQCRHTLYGKVMKFFITISNHEKRNMMFAMICKCRRANWYADRWEWYLWLNAIHIQHMHEWLVIYAGSLWRYWSELTETRLLPSSMENSKRPNCKCSQRLFSLRYVSVLGWTNRLPKDDKHPNTIASSLPVTRSNNYSVHWKLWSFPITASTRRLCPSSPHLRLLLVWYPGLCVLNISILCCPLKIDGHFQVVLYTAVSYADVTSPPICWTKSPTLMSSRIPVHVRSPIKRSWAYQLT